MARSTTTVPVQTGQLLPARVGRAQCCLGHRGAGPSPVHGHLQGQGPILKVSKLRRREGAGRGRFPQKTKMQHCSEVTSRLRWVTSLQGPRRRRGGVARAVASTGNSAQQPRGPPLPSPVGTQHALCFPLPPPGPRGLRALTSTWVTSPRGQCLERPGGQPCDQSKPAEGEPGTAGRIKSTSPAGPRKRPRIPSLQLCKSPPGPPRAQMFRESGMGTGHLHAEAKGDRFQSRKGT